MQSRKEKLYSIIFEAETPEGRLFDICLIVAIAFSLIVSALDSVEAFRSQHRVLLSYFEIILTVLFTLEYIVRIYVATYRFNYIKSFFGIIDLLAILPYYLALVLPGVQSLAVIRGLRVVRIFRIFKLGKYSRAGQFLQNSILQSWPKISVFLTAVATMVFVMGALMYLIEGPAAGFTSIPKSMYWAVVTMTTVGYGDLVPITPLGQFIAVILMICGYAIIAVPTGIVSAEMTKVTFSEMGLTRTCPECYREGHRLDAKNCYNCGGVLANDNSSDQSAKS